MTVFFSNNITKYQTFNSYFEKKNDNKDLSVKNITIL